MECRRVLFRSWGLERLEHHEYDESVDEMKHADRLIKRVLFLEGLPNLQDLGRLRIGETVREVLEADLALEMDGLPLLRETIAYCESIKDYVSRERSEEHTYELQSLMRISYAVFC